MAKPHLRSQATSNPEIYKKAAKRLAFRDAMLKASIITIASAFGVFLAGTPAPLFLWFLEFVIALVIAYAYSLRQIKEESADLIDKLNE